MLTTAEATEAIFAAVQPLDTESAALQAATGRVLAQSVHAERDQPPFDRVMMDGIAIAHSDFAEGKRTFPIQSTQAAGDPAKALETGSANRDGEGSSRSSRGNARRTRPRRRQNEESVRGSRQGGSDTSIVREMIDLVE